MIPNVIALGPSHDPQRPPRAAEVGVRLEAEAPCEVDGTEHEVLRELERDRNVLRLPRPEVLALEGLELAPAHPPRPDRVLDPEAPCVDQVAAHGRLVASFGRGDENTGDAAVAGVSRRAGVVWPIAWPSICSLCRQPGLTQQRAWLTARWLLALPGTVAVAGLARSHATTRTSLAASALLMPTARAISAGVKRCARRSGPGEHLVLFHETTSTKCPGRKLG